MHLLRHSEEFVLQLVEFLERHEVTLSDAKVRRHTGLSVYDVVCDLRHAAQRPMMEFQYGQETRGAYGQLCLDGSLVVQTAIRSSPTRALSLP
jgi:hypothetical protein